MRKSISKPKMWSEQRGITGNKYKVYLVKNIKGDIQTYKSKTRATNAYKTNQRFLKKVEYKNKYGL